MLLFIVAAIGYPLGRVKIKGTSLGVAAVLFVGLAFGALHPDLKLPEIVYTLGLVLFVYTIGLSSGAGFFASFRRKGVRDNLLILGVLCFATALTIVLHHLFQFQATLTAGMFAGSLTNTPALAGVLEYIKGYAPQNLLDPMLNEPVVGYSITYPMGVVGMILTIVILQRAWKIDYAEEAKSPRGLGAVSEQLDNRTVRVTNAGAAGQTIKDLVSANRWRVVFGRFKHGQQITLATYRTRFEAGDLVSVIGEPADLEHVTAYLGEPSTEQMELDRSEFDHRRIFVSNPSVAGKHIQDLRLPRNFGAIITRIRRGDMDWLPDGGTRLELGDRVRVLTHRENIAAVNAFFGDSYKALSEIDILAFGLGVALGLALGIIPIPLPGGVTLKLGFAGGPLIMALILGTMVRTGPIVWSLPYSANLTLRQIGLVFFLAGVGTRSGYAFVNTLTQGNGVMIFIAGAILTCAVSLATLLIGKLIIRIPMGLLIGMLAGMQTQPAVLGFSLEQTGDESPNIGYATVYPLAMIAKILLAQLVLTVLR